MDIAALLSPALLAKTPGAGSKAPGLSGDVISGETAPDGGLPAQSFAALLSKVAGEGASVGSVASVGSADTQPPPLTPAPSRDAGLRDAPDSESPALPGFPVVELPSLTASDVLVGLAGGAPPDEAPPELAGELPAASADTDGTPDPVILPAAPIAPVPGQQAVAGNPTPAITVAGAAPRGSVALPATRGEFPTTQAANADAGERTALANPAINASGAAQTLPGGETVPLHTALNGNPRPPADMAGSFDAALGNTPDDSFDNSLSNGRNVGIAATSVGGSSSHTMSPTTPTTPTPTAIQTSLTAPISSPAWQQQLGQQLSGIAMRGRHQVEMHLNPADLGPLSVSLKVDDQGAQVQFLSAHGSVRSAVEQAIPQLREALAEQGIALGEASVGEQQRQFGGQSESDSQHPTGNPQGGEELTAIPTTGPPIPTSGAGVDTYA